MGALFFLAPRMRPLFGFVAFATDPYPTLGFLKPRSLVRSDRTSSDTTTRRRFFSYCTFAFLGPAIGSADVVGVVESAIVSWHRRVSVVDVSNHIPTSFPTHLSRCPRPGGVTHFKRGCEGGGRGVQLSKKTKTKSRNKVRQLLKSQGLFGLAFVFLSGGGIVFGKREGSVTMHGRRGDSAR